MKITFSTRFRTVSAIPSRSGVFASPADRRAPPTMKKMSIPKLKTNIILR